MYYFLLLFSGWLFATPPLPHNSDDSAKKMIEAVNQFLSLVDESDTQQITFDFETDERTNWNFLPMTGERKGLALRDMTHEQRVALHKLLQTALSTEGYLKVTAIQQLERLVGELENRPDYRNPGFYYLSIFGKPSLEGAWGWRFEGHHLSLNFSMVNGQIAGSPAFLGTNPGRVHESVFSGLEVLSTEIRLARQLMMLLSEDLREKAIIAEKAPREIITGNSRVAMLDAFEGLSFKELDNDQQDLLVLLLSTYIHNMEADLASAQLKRIKDSGLENLYFAWAGSLHDGEAHYYRIHGPNLLIEYDNTQNNANHVHSIWRDLDNDFGRDYLRQHYEHSDHNHD